MKRPWAYATRRLALKAAVAGSLVPVTGCSWLLRRRSLQPVCPNAASVSYLDGPLTVDAHCHVFNGTDLQIKAFFSRIATRQAGLLGFAAQALGDLLENLAWRNAPSGDEERARLGQLAAALQTCTSEGFAARIRTLKQDGHARGKAQLRMAAQKSRQLQSLRSQAVLGTLNVAPDSDDAARLEALAIIESLPDDVNEYEALLHAKGLQIQSARSSSVQGLIAFVLQNFQYRYVSVHDYLRTYNRPGSRVVDLMLPSLVDYDFWLTEGDPTWTPLKSQVQVMRQIAILTAGRVHSFVPFDPLRQVAFELGHAPEDSLTLVKRAINDDGAIGVKLYPPMGFAPLGNSSKDGQDFWKQTWLPAWTGRADLGSRLDAAMRQVFAWCIAEQVPVMAHTSASNGPTSAFEQQTAAEYWQLVLDEFPQLRVSFGHFGGTAPVKDGLARAQAFAKLMNGNPSAAGSLAYADAGYFVEIMSKEPELQTLVQQLYEETIDKGDAALANRFMYGTDWEMTLVEGTITAYLGDFEAMFAQMESRPLFRSRGITDLAGRFFGFNAARWAGLFPGDATRIRLNRFYQAHGITPDWTVKLDRTAAASNR